MKTHVSLKLITLSYLVSAITYWARAQGTAFTYQGRLNDGGNPANGAYDFRFRLASDPLANNYVGGAYLTNGIAVSNGLFITTMDFGPGIFTGSNYWLEVDVRTNNGGTYTALNPLQAVTPAPYAIFAANVGGGGLSTGTYGNAVTFNNASNSFSGSFTGNGAGLTNVNAATLGGLGASHFWQTTGNAGTTAGTNFVGTTDNQPLELDVAGVRVLRLEPDPRFGTGGDNAGNLIGGSTNNTVEQPQSGGNAIGGGGYYYGPNVVHSNSSGIFIGAGAANQAGPDLHDSFIGSGYGNSIQSGASDSTIGGGYRNKDGSPYATVGGGGDNLIGTNANSGTVSGGFANQIADNTHDATIGGGSYGSIGTNSFASTIAGGSHNSVGTNAAVAAIGGGTNNNASAFATTIAGGADNTASAWGSTVGGGAGNTASSPDGSATVGGGYHNTASGDSSTAAGGAFDTASANYATVSGGDANTILTNANYSAIGGGELNVIQSNVFAATIGGGDNNTIQANAYSSTIGGGAINTILANAHDSTICGGYDNTAAGQYSFAAGQNADARDDRTFIWSSYPNAAPTFGPDEFYVSATNGLSINCGAQRPDGGGQYWMNIGTPGSGVLIQTSVGASLSLSGVWQNASDRARKTDFAAVDPIVILDKLARLSVQSWRYTNEVAGVRHLGPTAQDFMVAFGLGTDNKTIGTVDEDGVALAAIQGLNRKLNEKDAEIQRLKQQNETLGKRLDHLENAVKLLAAKN